MIGAGPGGDIDARSLYSTRDGGLTWRLTDGPSGYYQRELNFIDETTGFIAVPATHDSAPELLRSINGGMTWAGIQAIVQ